MNTTHFTQSLTMTIGMRLAVVVAIVALGAPNPSRLAAQQPLTAAGQSATVFSDGTTLFVGGIGPHGPVTDVSVWSAETGQTTRVGSLHHPRTQHTATVLASGHVAIIGGLDAEGRHVAAVEILDPASGAVVEVLEGPRVARAHHTATLLPNGLLLVAGGSSDGASARADAELWDPDTDDVVPGSSSG